MSDPVTRLNAALEGRYAIERELGEGGMATVYLADDLKHNRKVALKVLKPELAAIVGAERFLAEIQVTANLQHPNILPLFDSGEADSFLFYVMPYVEGDTLKDRLAREGQLPVNDAVAIARDVAEALQAAHEQGVIHRDIKPGNILISRGKPLIADFGIALAISAAGGGERLTETGLSLGTPYYMSPEQATGDQPVGPPSDMYALGCVLYQMLVGEPPYVGSSAQAVLGKIVQSKSVSPKEHRASVPANVDAAVRRALEILPADRFTSAQEFVRALGDEHFRYGEAVAGLAGADSGLWKRLSIGLATLAAVGLGAVVWFTSSQPPATPPVEVTRRLVVIPLENLTEDPDLDVLGRLAADQMARAIDHRRPVPVVPSTTVARTIRSLGGDPSVEAVAIAVEATHAFAGTVALLGNQIRFEVELLDVRTSERLRTLDPVVGPADAADSLAAVLASRAATAAVVVFDPTAPPWLGDISLPVSIAAFEAFTEQGDIFCTGDYLGSIEPGMRAVELSPRFVAAIYQLAMAHGNLGNQFEVDSLFAVLEGLRSEMTRNEELSFDWLSSGSDPARKERAIEEAFRLDPAGRGGTAMMVAYRGRRMNRAIERLSHLDLDGPCRWSGYWVQGTIAYHALDRYDEELGLIRHGLGYYPQLREMLDVEVRALVGLGRLVAVDSLLQVVGDLPPSNFEQNFRPLYAALELRAHGFASEAERLLTKTLDEWTVNRPQTEDQWNHARALYWGGRWGDALPMLQSLVDEYPDRFAYLTVYGATLARLGRRADALAMSDRLGQLGDRRRGAGWGRGMIAAALGERDDAVRFLNLGFDNGRNYDNFIHLDPTFDDMWSYAPFEVLMRPR